MNAEIRSVDYAPPELDAQLPIRARLVRQVPGPDRPDYWLAELESPLAWREGSNTTAIRWLVLASRYEGQSLSAKRSSVVVAISYVIDESQLDLARLDFSKCHYAAIGEAAIS
jgi:hypothetical protein